MFLQVRVVVESGAEFHSSAALARWLRRQGRPRARRASPGARIRRRPRRTNDWSSGLHEVTRRHTPCFGGALWGKIERPPGRDAAWRPWGRRKDSRCKAGTRTTASRRQHPRHRGHHEAGEPALPPRGLARLPGAGDRGRRAAGAGDQHRSSRASRTSCTRPSPCCSPRATSCSRTCPASARRCWPRPSPGRSTARCDACSSPPTCCPATSPASACSTRTCATSSSGPARSSPTSSSVTRSTAPHPRPSRRCSSRWRRARSRSTARPTTCPSRSS